MNLRITPRTIFLLKVTNVLILEPDTSSTYGANYKKVVCFCRLLEYFRSPFVTQIGLLVNWIHAVASIVKLVSYDRQCTNSVACIFRCSFCGCFQDLFAYVQHKVQLYKYGRKLCYKNKANTHRLHESIMLIYLCFAKLLSCFPAYQKIQLLFKPFKILMNKW